MAIQRPSEEDLELEAAEDRLAQERFYEMHLRELEQEEHIAKLKFSVNLRQKALLRIAKAPAHIACIIGITLITLFGKPVPPSLQDFLNS